MSQFHVTLPLKSLLPVFNCVVVEVHNYEDRKSNLFLLWQLIALFHFFDWYSFNHTHIHINICIYIYKWHFFDMPLLWHLITEYLMAWTLSCRHPTLDAKQSVARIVAALVLIPTGNNALQILAIWYSDAQQMYFEWTVATLLLENS